MTISRRDFIVRAALAGTAISTVGAPALAQTDSAAPPAPKDADIRWLDDAPPALHEGQTWGVPWPRGTKKPRARFALKDAAGRDVPVQTWTTATWPDGSIKWTAHAIPAGAGASAALRVMEGQGARPPLPLR
ncbi:RIFT barrel domain-containing protein [Pedomonas mirosovicensis]|uniref:RIFT barrel domain-containing protein n=1 Tax=Pedomonas mirosovicensis TaxID=2908641 RepID=UPI0035BC0885